MPCYSFEKRFVPLNKNMNKHSFTSIRSLFMLAITVLGLYACIDPYPLSFNQENKILVVEGMLTNDFSNPDTIKINYSIYRYGNVIKEPASTFDVYVYLLNSKQKIQLVQIGLDAFVPSTGFDIDSTEKYTLNFSIYDSEKGEQKYTSTPQQIASTSPILKVYDSFNPQSELSEDGKKFNAANDVFIDFQDTPSQKNYYLWRYIHYEKLEVCATCNYGIYSFYAERCIPAQGVNYYDYNCLSNCYGIMKSKKINVFSDLASDGRLITGRRVAQIPFYFDNGCLVEIQQMGISPDAYTFYKNLESQTQTNGGLADTTPTAIVGNINNISNPDEKVVGFFNVVAIQKKRYWIDRATAKGEKANILGHIMIRDPNPMAPLATCKKSATRTPFQPEGWQ